MALALISIAILLWIVLRRVSDVLLTLIPLIVAGLVTLEICALTNFQLSYANIIALPVLLGVGVAFKIYYVTAWRLGESDFLELVLTRRGLLQHTSDRDPHSEVCGSPISQVYRAWVSCWLYHLCAP